MSQELAGQAAAKTLELQQVGEGLQLSVDREQQLREIAGLRGELEKLKVERSKEVALLPKKMEVLAKDKVSLKDKKKFLQEKNKKMTQEHKHQQII